MSVNFVSPASFLSDCVGTFTSSYTCCYQFATKATVHSSLPESASTALKYIRIADLEKGTRDSSLRDSCCQSRCLDEASYYPVLTHVSTIVSYLVIAKVEVVDDVIDFIRCLTAEILRLG